MLNIKDINETIEQLEQGPTTFEVCNKLATLYTVRKEYGEQNAVSDELNDIMPRYKRYCKTKQQYQLRELGVVMVYQAMADVCSEISEFIETLYSHTDTEEERSMIQNMVLDIYNKFPAERAQ